MPKDTFFNIKPAKRKAITDAFLKEFSDKVYEDASISAVVKSLGIAKGSIYQYFTDKLDLYLYLKTECEKIKMKYVMDLQRDNYESFWTFYRAMYEEGVKFDLENPLASKFLYAVGKNEHSLTIKSFVGDWRDQAISIFGKMIEAEINAGHFRQDVPIKTMATFLVSVSRSIGDYMLSQYQIDFEENIKKGKPVFAEQKEILLQSVDQNILLLKKAFEND